jgi:hypothetical protein
VREANHDGSRPRGESGISWCEDRKRVEVGDGSVSSPKLKVMFIIMHEPLSLDPESHPPSLQGLSSGFEFK